MWRKMKIRCNLRTPPWRRIVWTTVAIAAVQYPLLLTASETDCARTLNMQVYSSAFIAEGSGDLDGYELAVSPTNNSKVDALLFVYEGAPDDGIPLSGNVSDKNLTIKGNWIEHQIEYPSKREVIQTHSIMIVGTADPYWFNGTIKVEGLVTPGEIRLKRVPRIWMCRNKK
jgi:hypothetical protein